MEIISLYIYYREENNTECVRRECKKKGGEYCIKKIKLCNELLELKKFGGKIQKKKGNEIKKRQ